jgi:hypothetical protein
MFQLVIIYFFGFVYFCNFRNNTLVLFFTKHNFEPFEDFTLFDGVLENRVNSLVCVILVGHRNLSICKISFESDISDNLSEWYKKLPTILFVKDAAVAARAVTHLVFV